MDNGNDKILIQLVRDIAEVKAMVQNYADIELRVRELEKARWKSAWITGLLSAAVSSSFVAILLRLVMI
jgi:3'-phosphoadenosine 5'-phosphosulfate sulfotransferase